MKTQRDGKTTKPKPPAKMSHVLQVRLSERTLSEIDYMIATVPQLSDFNRSGFLVAAAKYVLESLRGEGYQRYRRAGRKSARH
ncbi:MAG TPA: hypothetical protein VKU19_16445 [Bryobacteraceae bacterium]|nr:hypothetical protein [Bryobacteraceae bacterium]